MPILKQWFCDLSHPGLPAVVNQDQCVELYIITEVKYYCSVEYRIKVVGYPFEHHLGEERSKTSLYIFEKNELEKVSRLTPEISYNYLQYGRNP